MSASAQPSEEHPPGWAQEDKGPLILVVTSTMTAITFLFVASRIYSRILALGKLAIDDYIVVFCNALSFIYVGLASLAIKNGGGRHAETLSPDEITSAVYYTVISFVPGVSSFIIPKLAVAILLIRLLAPGPIHKSIMWIVSVLYFGLGVGMLIINFVQCSPPERQWKGEAVEGTCWDRKITVDYAIALGVTSAVFDFYLAAYPTIVLWNLQMHLKKKIALCAALGFGYCATIVTIYKCTTLPGLLTLKDFTYAVDDVVLWTNIEANCVIIGACIPTMFPLVKKIFGNKALGDSGPGPAGKGPTDDSSPIVTIGSYPKKSRRPKSSQFGLEDTVDDSKYIILEERSYHQSTTELKPGDEAVLEQARGVKHPGW